MLVQDNPVNTVSTAVGTTLPGGSDKTGVDSVAGWLALATASIPGPESPLGSADWRALEEAAELARRLAAAATSAQTRLIAAAARLASAHGVAEDAVTELFATRTRTSSGAAAQLVKQGDDQARCPRLAEQFAAGELDARQFKAAAEQVRSITGGMSREQQLQADEAAARIAATTPTAQLKTIGERILAEVAPETQAEAVAARAERQRKRAWSDRKLEFTDDGQGSMSIYGSLPIPEGRRVEQLITTMARRPRTDGTTPTNSQRRADALIELALNGTRSLEHKSGSTGIPRAGEAAATGGADLAVGDDGPRGADVFAPSGSTRPSAGRILDGDRPTLLVTLKHEDLVRELQRLGKLTADPTPQPGRSTLVARTLHGDILSPREVRLLACEADIIPVVLGGDSEPLDVGRAHRTATLAQRRALALRDRGCIYPGCQAPPEQCHKHHITPWHQGGPTDLDNLVLVCNHHHTEIEPDPNGTTLTNWQVELRDSVPWLIPPKSVDLAQKPIVHARFLTTPGTSGSKTADGLRQTPDGSHQAADGSHQTALFDDPPG